MTNYLNLKDYESKKQKSLSYLNEVLDISQELNVSNVSQYLVETIKQLERDSFLLTVVGEFSRGKSTFINALLGKNVLPSKVKPTTAMINRIYYQDTPGYSITFRDSKKPRKAIDEASFRKLCAPREPDEDDVEDVQRYNEELEFFKEIAMAEIGYPNHFCKAGVEIYDTPGTNDIDEAREEITFKFVPKSDAVIFLLSATTPFGASEKEFLKDRILSEHISKVFFVVNFKDRLLNEEDQQKVVTYIRDNLTDLVPDPRIFLVSSLDTLTIRRLEQGEQFKVKSQRYLNLDDTGFSSLETDLSHFLQYEKGQSKLEKINRRLIKKIQELQTETIALRLSASEMEIGEIESKIAELQPQVDKFRKQSRVIIQRLLDDLYSEEDTLIRLVESQLRSMIESIIQSLDGYSGSLDDNKIKAYLQKQAKSHQNKIQTEINELKGNIIEQHVSNAYKKLNSKEEELNSAVQSTFNLKLDMNHNFDLTTYETDGDILGMIIGAAGMGLSALILAPALLVVGGIGTAIGAFFFGDSIEEAYKDYKRTKKINEVKEQVKHSLYESRSNIIGNFKSEWRSIIQKIELNFENEVNNKTLKLQTELHQIRLDKELEKRSVEDQKRYLESLNNQLSNIKANAYGMVKQTT